MFRMIPGLEQAEIVRYGVMHRNSFIDSPRLLGADYALRSHPNIFFAGQIKETIGKIAFPVHRKIGMYERMLLYKQHGIRR